MVNCICGNKLRYTAYQIYICDSCGRSYTKEQVDALEFMGIRGEPTEPSPQTSSHNKDT